MTVQIHDSGFIERSIEALKEAWKSSNQTPPHFLEAFQGGDFRFELYPHLRCYYEGFIIREWRFPPIVGPKYRLINSVSPNQPWRVKFTVENMGNATSWACIVEVREQPGYKLLARNCIALQPYQSREIRFKVETGDIGKRLIGVCYDPIFDSLSCKDISLRKSAPLAVVGERTAHPPKLISPTRSSFKRAMKSFINLDDYIDDFLPQ